MTFKKCSGCKEVKPRNTYSKNKSSNDGLQNVCKRCSKTYDDSKGKLSKEAAIAFIDDLTTQGELFTCGCCGSSATAGSFYHQRKRGGVNLILSKCKSCQREYQRLKTFGITQEGFNLMLAKQDNKCSICGIDHDVYRKSSYKNKCFAVDHCHTTGEIRGALCEKCNKGLGYFDDNKEHLLKAISYLEGDDIV